MRPLCVAKFSIKLEISDTNMEIVERRSAAMKLERSMFGLEPKCDVKQAGGRSSVKPKSDDI